MNIKDITLVVAVDDVYIEKLWWSYQTWVKFKPEIKDMPLLLIYDAHVKSVGVPAFQILTYDLGKTGSFDWARWNEVGYSTQREKMLTSLVFAPAEHVKTPWYLKLDADTFANAQTPWIDPKWFLPKDGKDPAFVASPWGYTKPGNLLDILDDWGDKIESLKGYPRLNIPHEPNSSTVSSPRMASWVMFGNVDWLQEAVKACPDKKLPVPSQDTFLYYMAHRRGDYYVRERMGNYGWKHAHKLHVLRDECQKLLGNDAIIPTWQGVV